MLRLTLVCHGATAANRLATFPLDEPLEPRSLAAARAFARRGAAAIAFSSPALRARQTAEAMNIDAVVEPALRDCDYGRWAGQALEAVAERKPEAMAAFLHDPSARPHGGESIDDLVARAGGWLDPLLQRRGSIVAVTHAAVIRAALIHVLRPPLDAFWRIDVPPLSATALTSDGRRWAWRAGDARFG
ncbi:MAG: histidine phosphatase family protein [Amaricoccus sp.]